MTAPEKKRSFVSDAVYFRALFILANLFVYATAIIPGPDIPEIISSVNDKLLHALEYAVLFGLTIRALGTFPQDSALRLLRGALAMAWCLGTGILTEMLQTRTFGRSGDPADAAADAAGILFGYCVWRVIVQKRKSSEERQGPRGNF